MCDWTRGSYHCRQGSILFVFVVLTLAGLHGDLFSRHACPMEGYVFVAVDERGEDVMSDEICRRNNEKQERRRRGGRTVQLPD